MAPAADQRLALFIWPSPSTRTASAVAAYAGVGVAAPAAASVGTRELEVEGTAEGALGRAPNHVPEVRSQPPLATHRSRSDHRISLCSGDVSIGFDSRPRRVSLVQVVSSAGTAEVVKWKEKKRKNGAVSEDDDGGGGAGACRDGYST